MMRLLYKVIIIAFVCQMTAISQNIFEEMRNAFLLGLREEGLKKSLDILSKNEYQEYRERTVYFVAERLFYEVFLSSDQEINKVNQAYTFFLKYASEYPQGQHIDIVKSRISTIKAFYSEYLLFGELFTAIQNERYIVKKKIENANVFAEVTVPEWYKFYFRSKNEQSIEVLSEYYESIAKNHPTLAIHAIYRVFLISIRQLYPENLVKQKIVTIENDKKDHFMTGKERKEVILSNAEKILKRMILIDPNGNNTLDAHLILANLYIEENIWGSAVLTKKVLGYLNYVLLHDTDQLSMRYVLTKEFVLNNKFDD